MCQVKCFFLLHGTLGGDDEGETKERMNRNERKRGRIDYVVTSPPPLFSPTGLLGKESILLPSLIDADFILPTAMRSLLCMFTFIQCS